MRTFRIYSLSLCHVFFILFLIKKKRTQLFFSLIPSLQFQDMLFYTKTFLNELLLTNNSFKCGRRVFQTEHKPLGLLARCGTRSSMSSEHKVYRVPRFLSSRQNWLPPPPYPLSRLSSTPRIERRRTISTSLVPRLTARWLFQNAARCLCKQSGQLSFNCHLANQVRLVSCPGAPPSKLFCYSTLPNPCPMPPYIL